MEPPRDAECEVEDDETGGRPSAMMIGLRYVLPAVVTAVGLGLMLLGGESNVLGGAGVVSAGLAIYFVNWLFRAGATGDLERERENEARAYYRQHGRWPD